MILLAQRDDAFPGSIGLWCAARPFRGCLKKHTFGILAELMTENAKTAVAVAEAPGSFLGRQVIDEESAKRLVLAVSGVGRVQEDLDEVCYLIY